MATTRVFEDLPNKVNIINIGYEAVNYYQQIYIYIILIDMYKFGSLQKLGRLYILVPGFKICFPRSVSDNGYVSDASQTAEGQGTSCVSRLVFRYSSYVPGYWGGTEKL
jgi:hypothetical protein